MDKETYYISTAIAYTSRRNHIQQHLRDRAAGRYRTLQAHDRLRRLLYRPARTSMVRRFRRRPRQPASAPQQR